MFPSQGSNLCLVSSALTGRSFTTSATWEAHRILYHSENEQELCASTPTDSIPNKQAKKNKVLTILHYLWRLQNYARLSSVRFEGASLCTKVPKKTKWIRITKLSEKGTSTHTYMNKSTMTFNNIGPILTLKLSGWTEMSLRLFFVSRLLSIPPLGLWTTVLAIDLLSFSTRNPWFSPCPVWAVPHLHRRWLPWLRGYALHKRIINDSQPPWLPFSNNESN